ncbi:MAG TPA: CYCXC family (seleno)protein [Gemmatimonadaceae bacterium]|nr:CYCXC family (seleno)protein [Gemmatimonadaceae bacterium]
MLASQLLSRRDALKAAAAASAALLLPRAASATATHPDPRPGITGEHVLSDPNFRKKVAEVYDMAREIPEVFDGLHCYCECHTARWGHRSLLSCFESNQPDGCHGCQEEARLAYRLHKDGKSLEEVRAAVDKEFK